MAEGHEDHRRFAAALGAPTPLFNASAALYNAAMALGYAREDTASVCAVLERMAGLRHSAAPSARLVEGGGVDGGRAARRLRAPRRHLGRPLGGFLAWMVALALVGVVIVAVHHAEVVALRVGEPFGTLVLALAVTVIESGSSSRSCFPAGPAERWRATPCSLP